MNDAEYIDIDNHSFSRVQLRELFGNIIAGDYDYARSMLTLFENQKLERLQKDREASQETSVECRGQLMN